MMEHYSFEQPNVKCRLAQIRFVCSIQRIQYLVGTYNVKNYHLHFG
jgi:hypothetical protein